MSRRQAIKGPAESRGPKLPFYALSTYLHQRFGRKIHKIPLDAGFTCPNRDGTIGTGGCLYCNPSGSGSGYFTAGLTLAEQWTAWTKRLRARTKASFFLAYLQSFSNTHGPLERIESVLNEISQLPNMIGLCLGTRPDCLDPAKLDLIARFPAQEIWLEIGLQSASNQTLQAINRGHTAACFAQAVESAESRGIKVCAHVIFGLPGESLSHALETIDFINTLPVHGIKFHQCYVCKNTGLSILWREGGFIPLEQETYVNWTVQALSMLRPDIVVQRLTGDPSPGELLAPAWASDKTSIRSAIIAQLEQNGEFQGYGYGISVPPTWFSPESARPDRLKEPT